MANRIDDDRFPEWRPFADAVRARRPETGTWCAAWTVRDIVAHQAACAAERDRRRRRFGPRDHRCGVHGPMKVPWFAEHMREEIVLHGWDITGDDPAAQARLGQSWVTDHSVYAVGVPLLARGVRELGLGPGERIDARLRVDGTPDIALTAVGDHTTIDLVAPDGEPTLETDAAARVLLLWGRRPADPARICSRVGQALGRVRTPVERILTSARPAVLPA